jgi:hypothetical protein
MIFIQFIFGVLLLLVLWEKIFPLCHCEARIGVSLNQSAKIMKWCLKFFPVS